MGWHPPYVGGLVGGLSRPGVGDDGDACVSGGGGEDGDEFGAVWCKAKDRGAGHAALYGATQVQEAVVAVDDLAFAECQGGEIAVAVGDEGDGVAVIRRRAKRDGRDCAGGVECNAGEVEGDVGDGQGGIEVERVMGAGGDEVRLGGLRAEPCGQEAQGGVGVAGDAVGGGQRDGWGNQRGVAGCVWDDEALGQAADGLKRGLLGLGEYAF